MKTAVLGKQEIEIANLNTNTTPYDDQFHVYGDQNSVHYYDDQFQPDSDCVHYHADVLLFCPEKLDLRIALIKHGHEKLVRHLWKFLHVITLLYLHRWNKSSDGDDYRPLMVKKLRVVLGAAHATAVLTILAKLRIIESDNHYVVGQRSRGYRLCEPYCSAQFRKITSKQLPRISPAAKREWRHRIETNGSVQHRHLLGTLRQITLDEAVYENVAQRSYKNRRKRDYYLRSVEFISIKQFFFSFDKRTGRVFNNVTSLPKEIRPFLRLGGSGFEELDVVNCQPFLLLDLYQPEDPERERFAKIVSAGRFYETLDEKLPGPFGAARRAELKKAVFSQILFDKNRPSPTLLNKAFQECFPSLHAAIEKMKAGNHNQLALHLQTLEASLIIGTVVRQIAEGERFPVLTIHDSLLVLPKHSTAVADMVTDSFEHRFGCSPRLRRCLL